MNKDVTIITLMDAVSKDKIAAIVIQDQKLKISRV
jgi:hypothetical protein